MAVKQLLPTLQVPNGNSSGKKLSNSLNHDSSYGWKFVCTNFVAQASADRSSSSCDQVPLSPTFLFVLCRYLKGKNFTRHEEKKKQNKIFLNEHPSWLQSTDLSTVRSPRQNLCPNNAIWDSGEQVRSIVPPYRKRSPKVWTCFEASIDGTNACKMMATISPLWINIESSQISWKSSRFG